MSDAGWAAITQITTTVIGFLVLWLKLRTTTNDIAGVKSDVRVIERATNSMKDALVKATGEAAFMAGGVAEREKKEDNRDIGCKYEEKHKLESPYEHDHG